MAPTIEDLISNYKHEAQRILDRAQRENRSNLTDDEDNRADALLVKIGAAQKIKSEMDQQDRASHDIHATSAATRLGGSNRTASLSVTRNERVYNEGNDPNGRQFLLDVARSAIFNDRQCQERLDRHTAEERVERPGVMSERAAGDATTTAFGVGLVVPQYLTDYYAPMIANMRPLANVVNHHDLPPQGMTLNLSRITTASSAAVQATQLTAVSATSLAETDLSLNVQTIAGSQNVSRQAIERGTGIEDATAQDLFKRVATALDSTLITQATTGIQAVAQGITYTSAAPTSAEFWPYLYQAESKLEQALLSQARVDYVCMHPRRFNWLASYVGSTWPFMGSLNSGVPPQQGMMQITNEYGASVRAVLANGLKVVVDGNVPTNTGGTQDEVYVLASDEIHLWEDPAAPLLIRADQANAAALGVLLVAYQYVAYTASRYTNNPSKITGTGLAAPAGF